MTPNATQTTATIYQFPVGGRAALSSRESVKSAADSAPRAAVGSGWYHEAAIEEAKRGSEH